MINRIQKSIKAKLFILFFALALFIIFVMGAISYNSAREALTEQLTLNLSMMSNQLSENIDRYLSERMKDTRAIALHYALFNLKTTTSRQNEVLARYHKIYPYYENINIINIDDIRLPDGIEPGSGEPWYMLAVTGEAASSDMFVSQLTDEPTMSFAAPIIDENGNIVSVLTTKLDLNYLWDIVDHVKHENERKGLTGYAFMVNSDGRLIAHPDRKKLFSSELIENSDTDVRDLAKRMTSGKSGVTHYTLEGVEMHAAYSHCAGFGSFKGHGWSVAVSFPDSELMEPIRPLLKIYLMIFLVAPVLAFIISTLLANYLVRPILSLKEGAANIIAGDFESRIHEKTNDELGELADTFNHMAETLQSRDRQISEYTHTLTTINNELEHKQDELSKANNVLVRTNDELIRLQKQKAEFTAMITHDIKSPLSTILTYAEMTISGAFTDDGGDKLKAMRNIYSSGHKILSLVDNFLASSAIEAGSLNIVLTPINLNSFIEEEASMFKPQMDKKEFSFTIELSGQNPYVNADKVQLDRVVSNLLSNSIKFTPQGESITITTGIEAARAFFSIQDSGGGINEADIGEIFSKYKRAGNTAMIEGVGLGLFITKSIVDAHGGDISAENVDGGGSRFTVYLPLISGLTSQVLPGNSSGGGSGG